MSGIFGGQKNVTSTTTSQPPAYALPYLQSDLGQATNLYNEGMPQYYPGETVAPFAPGQTQAQTAAIDYGLTNPATGAASDFLANTMAMNPADNPYTSQLASSVTNSVMPAVASEFEKAGRYGSPAMAYQTGKGITDALAPTLFSNYQNNLDRQVQAAGQVPGVTSATLSGINAASQAGAQQQTQAQNLINEAIQRYQTNTTLPYQNLSYYNDLLNGRPTTGSAGTSTQPYFNNPAAGGLGGALIGTQLASKIPALSTGWGAVLGAAAGLLG